MEYSISMNKILPLFLGFGIMAGAGVFAALALIGPTHKMPTQAQTPGNLSNPQFAEIFNNELSEKMKDIHRYYSLPTAKDSLQKYLSSIKEINTYCSFPLLGNSKGNTTRFDVTFTSGEKSKDKYIGVRCDGQDDRILRITFKQGIISEVFSDGSEKNTSLDSAKIFSQKLISSIIREETYKNSHLYNVPPPPEKTKDDFRREWNEKASR